MHCARHANARGNRAPARPQALAHDLGLALGCYAHVSALRREALGGFSVEDAWPLDVLLPTLRRFKPSVRRGVAGQ